VAGSFFRQEKNVTGMREDPVHKEIFFRENQSIRTLHYDDSRLKVIFSHQASPMIKHNIIVPPVRTTFFVPKSTSIPTSGDFSATVEKSVGYDFALNDIERTSTRQDQEVF
jgi:hypothetical protein